MINHFRTLLLNLSDSGDESEFISNGFASRSLNDSFLSLYKLLFPSSLSRTDILRIGQAYLELIVASGIDEVFTLVDTRITYDLDHDFNNFKLASIDFVSLYNKLSGNAGLIQKILSQEPEVNSDKYDNMWKQHPNPVYKVAGLIAAYTLRLS